MNCKEAIAASSIGAAQRDDDGCIAEKTSEGRARAMYPQGFCEQEISHYGGNWQPLAVSPVSDERVRELEHIVSRKECALARAKEKIERQAAEITRLHDKQREHKADAYSLQTRLDDLGEAYTAVTGERDGLEENYDALRAELSTLRAQLEGQWELGEPLTQEEFDATPEDEFLVVGDSFHPPVDKWTILKRRHLSGPKNVRAIQYYRWGGPLPTLPSEPEPEVKVPTWIGAVQTDGQVCFVERITPAGELRLFESAAVASRMLVDPKYCELYTKPVLHPDGTVAPIEPTQELLEALEKE